jgi:hypothetical protein
MSSSSKPNRLWVQVVWESKDTPVSEAGVPIFDVGGLIASGVGAIIKSTADVLIASDQYVTKTVLAYEPSFRIRAHATSATFLLNSIVLNVGPNAVKPSDVEVNGGEYARSPVVIWLKFDESIDGTALAPRVTHWKYEQFLDPSAMRLKSLFRTQRRKVTVEVKISDVDGGDLLATAMQVEADSAGLPNVRPNYCERLPWKKRPVKNFTGERSVAEDQCFGPVNIEASITEVCEPSRFARFLGMTVGSQKPAIEKYVRDRVMQAMDETTTAKAMLISLDEASKIQNDYQTAYKEAAEAMKAVTAAVDEADKCIAQQLLALKLATLRQKEILARASFDRAGLAFEPMPKIKDPAQGT